MNSQTSCELIVAGGILEQPNIITRDDVERILDESTLYFLEAAREVSEPASKKESRTTTWRGLGGVALDACQRQWQPVEPDPLANLTDRRRDIANLLIKEGKARQEVGDTLSIAAGTVSDHIVEMYASLDINSKEELAKIVPIDTDERKNVSMDILTNLTASQAKMLGYVVLRKDTGWVANKLKFSSPEIARAARSKMYGRLGLHNRHQAIRLGMILKDVAEQRLLAETGIDECLSQLTKSEAGLIYLTAQDKTRQEIATEMHIDSVDISNYWQQIKIKLNACSREDVLLMLGLNCKTLKAKDLDNLPYQQIGILADLTRGLSQVEIAKKRKLHKVSVVKSLVKARKLLGIRTLPVFWVMIEANRGVIQQVEASAYHQAHLTAKELEAIRLAMQGLSDKEIGEAVGGLSKSTIHERKMIAYEKLQELQILPVRNIFEASLLVDPPGAELLEGEVCLSEIEDGLEEEIFYSMADNPTDNELKDRFYHKYYYSARTMGRIVEKLKSKFNVSRLELARTAYAARQKAEGKL